MQIVLDPIQIGGDRFYTVSQFAAITNRSDQSVYKLIKQGNSMRKLNAIKVAQRVLIPAEEVTEFPFTGIGPNSNERIYHYNNEGEI